MTAARDLSRPASQHRLSLSANASSLPLRNPYSRSHSHTVSLGAGNRINRRKSSNFAPPNPAVIGAAVEHAVAEGAIAIKRRSSVSKAALSALNDGVHMSPGLPHQASVPESSLTGSALVDGPALGAFPSADKVAVKVRRASDGTHLSKKEKAAAGDLKCEHCGKAYKHGSCLNKHLWEHTPQWQYTSKLLISKHQQVQLLEAASVLVAMNADGTPATDSDNNSSSSPAASGSSDMRDDDDSSSVETTPPPAHADSYRDAKRLSNNSSAYSRSFQSIFSASDFPHHHRQWSSSSNRPTTGHTSIADSYRDEDPQDLAAAVGLLSCSYGTPKSGPTHLPLDVPPVPPLPVKYQTQSLPHAYETTEKDVHMGDDADAHGHRAYRYDEEEDDRDDDDDDDNSSEDDGERSQHVRRAARHHDDMDDGMFGQMDA